MGRSLFKGYRVLAGDDENVLEMDSGDDYTAVGMYLMPPNCTL